MIYNKMNKLPKCSNKAPLEDYHILIQHSMYRYITNISKDNEFVVSFLKPSITLRMQQFSPDEWLLLKDPLSYQVFFWFIGLNNEVVGNSFVMIFEHNTTIKELKDALKIKLIGLQAITWNNQKYDVDKEDNKMYLFKIDDINGEDVILQLPKDLKDLNDFHEQDVIGYILHSEMEESIAYIAIQLPIGIGNRSRNQKLSIHDLSQ